MKKIFALLYLFSFLTVGFSQIDSSLIDHQKAIKRIENSENELFEKILEEYNTYLAKHPSDLKVAIERCKFVNNALYDEYYDENPNQELADQLDQELFQKFPKNPEVLLYRVDISWGDSLQSAFKLAKNLIYEENNWTSEQKGKLYYAIAERHYYDEEPKEALKYINKAILEDSSYVKELYYSHILWENEDSTKAKWAALYNLDTTQTTWDLKQRADLLIALNAFEDALLIYNIIQEKDSNSVSNEKMAETFQGVGRYEIARSYYLKDTANSWNKNERILALFIHDLNYQNPELTYQSYNAYRDIGFIKDPLGVYRLKMLYKQPGAGWKFRDLGGILLLLFLITILLIIPSIWILPIYFIGHHYKIKAPTFLGDSWGLKAMWWVSFGYLFASLIGLMVNPENLNYYFDDTVSYTENDADIALSNLLFISVSAIFTLLTLFGKNLRILTSNLLPIGRSILMTLGYFFLYKLGSGIYIKVLGPLFDYNMIEGGTILLSVKQEITALISTYGLFKSLLVLAFLVPLYEEIVFRGIILESAARHITFKWANVLQSFLFALVHMDLFLMPMFFAFGMLTGNLRKRTGGLFACILFHIINNFIATTAINGLVQKGLAFIF